MTAHNAKISTGIPGIDTVLSGGFLPRRSYMVRGGPGTGKTTVGLHFLTATDERGLFISLGERSEQIFEDAAKQGFDLGNVRLLDLSPKGSAVADYESYDLMPPGDVEKDSLVESITTDFDDFKPTRVFIDSLTQMRYLAPDAFQFRKQVIALLRYLSDGGATVLFTSEGSPEAPDDDLMFLSDGVLDVGWISTGEKRWFRVRKYRGGKFAEGVHGLILDDAGVTVHPRLVPSAHGRVFQPITLGTGIPELDNLLHGGLETGTVTILTGPTGVGKTTLGAQLMSAAAKRGERAVMYTFEEHTPTLVHRCNSIGIPLESMIDRGHLTVEEIEPLAYSPDQFAYEIRREVEKNETKMVMLDSLAGYKLSVGGEEIIPRLHSLCRYLVSMGVTVLIANEVRSIAGGELRLTELDVSYLADSVIMLRYLEMDGELRKCIGVLKKRTGDFEKSLREFSITESGIEVGSPMRQMRGILRGEPHPVKANNTAPKSR